MNRRRFCKTIGTMAAGAGVLGTAGTTAASDQTDTAADGLVSALGHFEETDDGVVLTDGHTPTDSETVGTIPGFTTDESPEDILIPTHGVIDTETRANARVFADDVATSFDQVGYDGPVVGFLYDSANDVFQALSDAWSSNKPQREISRRSSHKLAAFVAEYARRSPETNVHLLGHSGGGHVTLEALEYLHETGWEGRVESVLLLGAGVDDEMVAADGRYGPAIASRAVTADSFYDPDDWLMNVGYSILRFDNSLGAHDVQGRPPENLDTHEVDDIDGHDSYYRPRSEGGAAEDVFAAF
jgi:pimeloyl-ACP methyl ester carboxylesterase